VYSATQISKLYDRYEFRSIVNIPTFSIKTTNFMSKDELSLSRQGKRKNHRKMLQMISVSLVNIKTCTKNYISSSGMCCSAVCYKFTLCVHLLLQERVGQPTGYTTSCFAPPSNYTPCYTYPLWFPGGGGIRNYFPPETCFLLASLPRRCDLAHHCHPSVRSQNSALASVTTSEHWFFSAAYSSTMKTEA
jgi:hypothetical protein